MTGVEAGRFTIGVFQDAAWAANGLAALVRQGIPVEAISIVAPASAEVLALMEQAVYDKDSGQLLTGSFMDYAMPRADDFPNFTLDTVCTPCTHNPLGTKGCGEAGAIGSPAAYINAVTDALGVVDLPMPATPERVWRAANGLPA